MREAEVIYERLADSSMPCYGSSVRLRDRPRCEEDQNSVGVAYRRDDDRLGGRWLFDSPGRSLHALTAWWETELNSEAEQAALRHTEALTRAADTDRDAAFQRFHDALAEKFSPEEILEIVGVVVNMNVWTRIKLAEGATPGPAWALPSLRHPPPERPPRARGTFSKIRTGTAGPPPRHVAKMSRVRRDSRWVDACRIQWATTARWRRRWRHVHGVEKAILAGGCFWGMQDLIGKRPGVLSTRVGYSGGDVANATYRNHGTHAEAIEIVFDPEQISYRDLLEFFFQIHDPTTPNRQGNDVGTSYRSAIFYLDEDQRRLAEDTIADVEASGFWPGKVVTEVTPAGSFWEAEPEHQDYLERYPNGYTCHFPRPEWVLPRRAESVPG
jgi:peptide-methionine (S)-S-oxide reductase